MRNASGVRSRQLSLLDHVSSVVWEKLLSVTLCTITSGPTFQKLRIRKHLCQVVEPHVSVITTPNTWFGGFDMIYILTLNSGKAVQALVEQHGTAPVRFYYHVSSTSLWDLYLGTECWLDSRTLAAGTLEVLASLWEEIHPATGGWKLLADWLLLVFATWPFDCWTKPVGKSEQEIKFNNS